jgi:hypothetical protein
MTEDLTIFFVDFGVAATSGAVGFVVLFDRVYDELLDGVGGHRLTALCKSSDVQALTPGAALSIEGQGSFVIQDFQPVGDGNLTRLILEEEA